MDVVQEGGYLDHFVSGKNPNKYHMSILIGLLSFSVYLFIHTAQANSPEKELVFKKNVFIYIYSTLVQYTVYTLIMNPDEGASVRSTCSC